MGGLENRASPIDSLLHTYAWLVFCARPRPVEKTKSDASPGLRFGVRLHDDMWEITPHSPRTTPHYPASNEDGLLTSGSSAASSTAASISADTSILVAEKEFGSRLGGQFN